MDRTQNRAYWQAQARRVAAVTNLSWCLEKLLPMLIGLNIFTAGALLLFRHKTWALQPLQTAYYGGLILVISLAYLLARRRFFSTHDGYVRIETQKHMHNRLSTAEAGRADWPEPAPVPALTFHYRPGPVAIPLTFAILILLAGMLVPIPRAKAGNAAYSPEEPVAWTQVDSWLETLEENEIVEEDTLEEMAEKLAELRSQPQDEWYSQGSLEAGDSLNERTQEGMESLLQDMQGMSEALSAMQESWSTRDTETLQAIDEAMAEMLQGLDLGTLPLNEDIFQALQAIDPSMMNSLSAEELQNLQQQLGEACEACQGALGELAEGEGKFASNKFHPNGPIQRGPGDAPLAFNQDANPSALGMLEGVSNTDLENAAIGDTLRVGLAEQDSEPGEFQGVTSGQGTSNIGQGGEAVWKDNLTPEERAVLKNYFK